MDAPFGHNPSTGFKSPRLISSGFPLVRSISVFNFYQAAKPAGFAADEVAVTQSGNQFKLDLSFSYLDLPFAMFSHNYKSKAIKLYYSMFLIA